MSVTSKTLLINSSTGQYPMSLFDLRKAAEGLYAFGDEAPEEILPLFDLAVVNPSEKPSDGNFKEGAPAFQNGVYVQVWENSPLSQSDLQESLTAKKQELLIDLKTSLEKALSKGFSYQFPTGTYCVQLREADRTNILGLSLRAERRPEDNYVFRAQCDTIIPLTGDQMLDMTDAAFDSFTAIMAAKWSIEAEIAASKTIEELPDIPSDLWTALP